MRLSSVLTMAVSLLMSSTASAQPGPNDAKVEWDATFPKKVGADLQMKGTVTFANGWSSANGSVVITNAPSDGGLAQIHIVPIVNGKWSLDLPLNGFPNPKRNYDITPSIQAWKGPGTQVYPVTGARQTMELP